MLGTFSNLKELDIICDEVSNEAFYLDFTDAFITNGFKNLISLKVNISLNNISDDMIFNFIDAVSEHSLLLEYLSLPFSIMKRKRATVQAAFFGNTWPNLRFIPQHLLQLQVFGNPAMRYAILDGLSPGSLQFLKLDTLLFRECVSVEGARAGLILPQDMSQIKHLTIIGRALRNPFLNADNKLHTFSGLETLDISGLEFPKCPDNIPPIPIEEFQPLQTEFNNRTKFCKEKLISAVSSAQLQSLKLGFTSIDIELGKIIEPLKSLEIIGRNPISWYESNEALCEQNVAFKLNNGLQKLRDGGELWFSQLQDSFETDPTDESLEEDDKLVCIEICATFLQNNIYLKKNLEHLKISVSWLAIDWDYIIWGGIDEVNEVLMQLYDLVYEDEDGKEEDDKDEEEDEAIIKMKISNRVSEFWMNTLSHYKKLQHFELKNFDDTIEADSFNNLIQKVAFNPPPNLSSLIVSGEHGGRNLLNQILLRRKQKTIENWLKPNRVIPVKPLKIVYTSNETSLTETLVKLDIKRWGLRE